MDWHSAFERVNEKCLPDNARIVGTPFVLIDAPSLHMRWHAFRESVPDVHLFLPYKSHATYFSRQYYRSQGLGAEVASAVELRAALDCGVPPTNIILNQPARDMATFRHAVALGATIVVDGIDDIHLLSTIETSDRIPVLLRVQARSKQSGTWSRFGMPVNEDILRRAFKLLGQQNSLKVLGVHSHLGTNIHSVDRYVEATELLTSEWMIWETQLGYRMSVLDLGGGFSTPWSCPVRHPQEKWRPDDPKTIVDRVRSALGNAGLADRLALWLEPGRILVEDAAILVTRVVDVRETLVGRQVTCDSGVHQIPTAGYLRHPIKRIDNEHQKITETASCLLFGALCMESDVIAADCILPRDLKAGDLLKIGSVGCYDIAMSFQFIHGACPMLLLQDNSEIQPLRYGQFDSNSTTRDDDWCMTIC